MTFRMNVSPPWSGSWWMYNFKSWSWSLIEHRGSRHSEGADSHVPHALCVRFSFDQAGVSALSHLWESPFSVEAYLSTAAVSPSEFLTCKPLSVGCLGSVFLQVRDLHVCGLVFSFFVVADVACVPEEFHREPFFEGVLLH